VENSTSVSNTFINEHLPTMQPDVLRVYIYGLYLCGAANRYDNTLEHFASTLSVTVDDVISAFTFLADLGLVQVLKLEPIEVKYLPPRTNASKIKKIKPGKYDQFNADIQAVIPGRMITPSEFNDYYTLLESRHMDPNALVMIAKYCVDIKGEDISGAYIMTVASNWAHKGIKTYEAVKEELAGQASETASVVAVLKALGIKRAPEPTDFEMYQKWRTGQGFSNDIVMFVAKKSKGSINKLDTSLDRYFGLKLFEKDQIENYEGEKSRLVTLARDINRRLGEYMPNVEPMIEEYLVPWGLKGFDDDTLVAVAAHCFRSGTRTLFGMDRVISKFYKMGLTNISSLESYIQQRTNKDKVIKVLLEKLGITRDVTQFDRDFYSTWKSDWAMSDEMIEYAASLSKGSGNAMMYMNRVLANWYDQKIVTVDTAKKSGKPSVSDKKVTRQSFTDREATKIFAEFSEEDF